MFGPKIKLDKELYERIKRFSDAAGYATVDEFVTHVLEKELSAVDDTESDEELKERLKGLGYLS